MENKWSSRKLIVFGIFFVSSIVFSIIGKLDGGELVKFWTYLCGLYMVGNVGEKFANKRNGSGIVDK